MRKLLAALACAAALSASACSSARERAFADGVEAYAATILPEYERYVDADPALKPETKRIRKETAAGLRRLVAEEKRALKD
jgi:hypothetical protein